MSARIVIRQTERIKDVGADERIARCLDVAERRERRTDATTKALSSSESAARRCSWQHRGNGVVAAQSDDLFDEVIRIGEVGSPGRWSDGEPLLSRHRATDGGQAVQHRLSVDVEARYLGRQRDGQVDA